VGQRLQPWRGFLLGYAQVPVDQLPMLVGQLAKVVKSKAH
jgi:GntR family transcriptional regulator/MocR family aminotransferase